MPEYTEGVQITDEAVEASAAQTWAREQGRDPVEFGFGSAYNWDHYREDTRTDLQAALSHLAPAKDVAELVEALRQIRSITAENYEDSGEMALAVDRIDDVARLALPTEQPEETDHAS